MTLADYVSVRNLDREPLWRGRGPLLSHLDVELTERCDNSCIHCCVNRPQRDAGAMSRELSTREWMAILRQAVDLGALTVRITGGEPLLRDDFAEIYLGARRLGLKVMLLSNARRVTPELAGLFARVPPLEKIEVSCYGMRPESYEEASGAPGSFAEFRRGVELLRERGVPFLLKGVLLPATRDELGAFEAWAAETAGMKEPPSCAMFFELRGRRDSDTRNRRIAALRATPADAVRMIARRGAKWRREMEEFCARFISPGGERLFSCGAGCGSACVDAYGMLQPCMPLRDPSLSCDLRTVPLRDGLAANLARLQALKPMNPGYLARCARCFLKGLCEQCPAKSWSEHGTLDGPVEYLCAVAHARARFLGLLSDGENAWEVADGPERVARLGGKAAT